MEGHHVKQAVIAANNHYAGFGQDISNTFRNMLGLSDAKCEDKVEEQRGQYRARDSGQVTLSDLLNLLRNNQLIWTRA